ncbi:MAG: DUF1573 domain-containing protein [Gemmataceae bacterium]|nr:DUF1573 domain-containing protein [Gemmataceae bacterium]MDW8264660.1 DUF1573 domain-containing protein [Gemmataceae bacterium]
MRYAIVAVGIVALNLGGAPAVVEKWAEKMFAPAGTVHDFGNVPRGAQLHHRFTITNIYAVPLQIMGTPRASCGCVKVTAPTHPLQSREKAYIDVVMDTTRFTGPKTVSIYVNIGPHYQSTAVLQVSANARADVVFNPGEISFGVVQRGQTPSQTIDVEYAGVLDWRVTGVVTQGTAYDATVEELYRRPGQVGYRLKVTVKPDAPEGSQKQDIFLQTNDPASPMVPVLVDATIQAPLSVVPATLNLGVLPVGKEELRRVVVRSSHKPFRIVSIEGLGDGLEAQAPPAAANLQVVTIKCQPGKAGEFRRQLIFKTDLDKEATATVTIEGTASDR